MDGVGGRAKEGSVERTGGSSNRERGITQQFKGPSGTTGRIDTRDADPRGPDRRAVSQFSQFGRNVMTQNLKPKRFQGLRSLASRFNPLSFILGLINPALGIASRFVTSAPDTFQTFKDSPTLADFLENMKTNKISDISVDSGRGSGLRQPIVPIEPISESDMSIPMIERISESDMSLLTPEQQLIQDQNVNEQVGDIRDIMAADGGMIGGGIMDAAGRQNYFLGKLVKKATRAVKKIVKSPIGKLGLGAALAFTPFGKEKLLPFVMKNKALAGAAGLIAAPFLLSLIHI